MEELVWVLWVETEIKESILSVVDPGMLSIIDSRSSPQSHFGDQVKKKKKMLLAIHIWLFSFSDLATK